MQPSDKQKVVDLYNRRLDEFGPDFRALASGTEERRRIRWNVLREVGLRDGSSVLDLGCGFGDFSKYLREVGLNIEYEGCDINSRLIELARERYPDQKFSTVDIQTDTLDRDYDFVVSSGAFNNHMQEIEQYDYIESIMAKAFAAAREGVAIDFMTDYVDFKTASGPFYYSPERIFKIAKKLTKRACLRHDYPLFEFCIYLYRDFEGWAAQR